MQPETSHHYYLVKKGESGAETLQKISFKEFNDQVATDLHQTVRDYVNKENSGVMWQIAAGTALKRFFETKAYRDLGLTKAGYCISVFDRDASTVNGYIAASDAYEDIGGLEATVQPNSVNQLNTLADVRPELRCEIWTKSAERNGGNPPPADLIRVIASSAKAWVEKKKKATVPEQPKLPCGTLDEAIAYVTQCQSLRKTGPQHWAKVGEFLFSLRQQDAQPVQVQQKRTRKPKAIREAKGQTLMFVEHLVAKAQ